MALKHLKGVKWKKFPEWQARNVIECFYKYVEMGFSSFWFNDYMNIYYIQALYNYVQISNMYRAIGAHTHQS